MMSLFQKLTDLNTIFNITIFDNILTHDADPLFISNREVFPNVERDFQQTHKVVGHENSNFQRN